MAITLTARDPRWNLATKRYGRSLVLAQTKSTAGPGVNRGLTPIYDPYLRPAGAEGERQQVLACPVPRLARASSGGRIVT